MNYDTRAITVESRLEKLESMNIARTRALVDFLSSVLGDLHERINQ